MEKLETYSSNVQSYITEKIDRPFYEAMDKVGASLEALNIANYTTGNIIGFKKTVPVVDGYGKIIGTQQKLVKEVGLRELYKVDNPYKKRLQASYQAYKTSDAYKQGKLSEEEYMLAHHQTRAFAYQSISDDQAAFEGVRDLALGVGVVVLSIFCPPAGAIAGVALASADM